MILNNTSVMEELRSRNLTVILHELSNFDYELVTELNLAHVHLFAFAPSPAMQFYLKQPLQISYVTGMLSPPPVNQYSVTKFPHRLWNTLEILIYKIVRSDYS